MANKAPALGSSNDHNKVENAKTSGGAGASSGSSLANKPGGNRKPAKAGTKDAKQGNILSFFKKIWTSRCILCVHWTVVVSHFACLLYNIWMPRSLSLFRIKEGFPFFLLCYSRDPFSSHFFQVELRSFWCKIEFFCEEWRHGEFFFQVLWFQYTEFNISPEHKVTNHRWWSFLRIKMFLCGCCFQSFSKSAVVCIFFFLRKGICFKC